MTDGSVRRRSSVFRGIGRVSVKRKGRCRPSSVSCTEESTEGEEEGVHNNNSNCGGVVVVSGGVHGSRRDSGKGIALNGRAKGINSDVLADAEEDVIDGFMILSFSNYQDVQHVMQRNKGDVQGDLELLQEVGPHQPESDTKEEGPDIPMDEPLLLLPHTDHDDLSKINNNEVTTPNQNLLLTAIPDEPIQPPVQTVKTEIKTEEDSEVKERDAAVKTKEENIICDTADEEKKVPEPKIEQLKPESPKRDVAPQVPSKPAHLFPTKPPHFLPLQNGPLAQPSEPSTAVAAVTVTSSAPNPATVPTSRQQPNPLPSSTSPAGGVPFPSSLSRQEDFPVSASTQTVNLSLCSNKSYDSIPSRGASSDVVHSLPFPICSSYSDCTSSSNYTANQYSNNSKHYHHHNPSDGHQRLQQPAQQKPAPESFYHHQDKYSKDALSRSSSKESVICEQQYKKESFGDSRKLESGDVSYRYPSYTHEKNCDPVYRKSSTHTVQNFQTNELLSSNGNVVKSVNDQSPNKPAEDCYSTGNKTKILNRTSYYQSIVNKTHSRQKSSRRVLPASAYDNSKQLVNSYQNLKPELPQSHTSKGSTQYLPQQYSTEGKKSDYPVPQTNNVYNYNYKADSHKVNANSNTCHNNWTDTRYSESKNYKLNPDQCTTGCRDKQLVNNNNKNYAYHYNSSNTRSHIDSHTAKTSHDPQISYGHSDYYQKDPLTYSKPEKHPTSSSNSYKVSGYSSEHGNYKNPYQTVKNAPEAKRTTIYQNHESNLKGYQKDYAPKQSAEDTYTFKVQSDTVSAHSNYSSTNSYKANAPSEHRADPPRPVYDVSPTNAPSDPIADGSSLYPYPATGDKNSFYAYQEQSQNQQRRTPPLPPKPQLGLEPVKLPSVKEDESTGTPTKLLPSVSPPPAYGGLAKTVWSPTTTTVVTSTSISNRAEVTPTSSRDSHSSHSNSSISSLSQLSQSFGSTPQGPSSLQLPKEFPREGRSSSNGHSRCSSRNATPVCSSSGPVIPPASTSATSSSASFGISGSLTSLIFSKPSWTSPSVTSALSSISGTHATPPSGGPLDSPVPSVLPLAPSLPSGHHSSPFAPQSSPAALHSAGHHVMFAPPLPPSGSLSSPLAAASAASPFSGESLFAPPNQDLLRRELDTRFLASQDRSINVPPPPYLRAEMHQHQHQHTHMHQHSPFLPPPIGGSLLPPSAAHLYDKFPKVDPSFYGRNALGLPSYPSISPLLAPGAASATPTPFAPPGHLAAFQPKMNTLVKAKSMKSGRWCAMHVRIAWEIYHHQQKQVQADAQKNSSSATKPVTDLLRPPNHLFGSMTRPHELGFSTSLLGAAASVHGRSPYDVPPQHAAFLGPSAAHLGVLLCETFKNQNMMSAAHMHGMAPFARPGYPGFGAPGNSFGGLGTLAGLTGASMLAGRDLGPGYLGVGQDPWSRLHRTPPNFTSPSAINPNSWGGLKAEAERDRLQRKEDHEREKEKEKQKKAEMEKREKESEKSKEIAREKREHEKQKERDRTYHSTNNVEALRNGEVSDRGRDREREWDRNRERRDASRSPIRQTHKTTDSAFEGSSSTSAHKQDVKVKTEKKEEDRKDSPVLVVSGGGSDRERTKSSESTTPHQDPVCDYIPRSMPPALGSMGLSPAEQMRLAGSLGALSQVPPPHFWNPLPPSPLQSSSAMSNEQRYRSLELQHARDQLDREQLMQKYASLSSMMPLLPERYREAELARHLSSSEAAARDIERQLQADRDRQVYERSKLPPPPLRPNDPPYVPPPGLPTSGVLFPSLANPFLNSLCPTTNYPPRTKTGSPSGTVAGNGIPPPLIPCVGGQSGSPVGPSATPSPLHLKMGGSATTSSSSGGGSTSVENSREQYSSSTKDRRDSTGHSSTTEVESQSR